MKNGLDTKIDPAKWAAIASGNDEDKAAMKDKVSQLNSEDRKKVDEFISRIEKVDKALDIDILRTLQFLLKPLGTTTQSQIVPNNDAELGVVLDDFGTKKPKTAPDHTPQKVLTTEKKSKTRAPLAGKSREEVISICNSHGLKTLDQLLFLLDKIQQAQRGNLQKN